MNFKKPLFSALILLSTSLIGCGTSANSQTNDVKVSEKPAASGSQGSKSSKTEEALIQKGWKQFQGQGLEIQLPKGYEGGNTKQNYQEVLQRIEKSGIERNNITDNFPIKSYEFFAVNTDKIKQGKMIAVNITIEEKPEDASLKDLMDAISEELVKNKSKSIEKKIVDLDNYQAGRIIHQDTTNNVKQALYIVENEQKIWLVLYTTLTGDFKENLPIFQESIKTFQVTEKA